MECIILAGGKGTRLGENSPPKALIELKGKTILGYRIEWLIKEGISHFVLALGYKASEIMNYIREKYPALNISYSIENEPLGTAGAIREALKKTTQEKIFVTNVDDITNIKLDELKIIKSNVICLARFKSPFGIVHIDNENKVLKFEEKPLLEDLWASCGFYYLDRSIELPYKGSIEYDVFPNILLNAYKYKGLWVTVNTQKDINEAVKTLP